MIATCSNCGQSIKNIITINGLPYGITCAEHKLGFKLPEGFSGDWDEKSNEIKDNMTKIDEQFKADSNIVSEIWEDARKLTRCWKVANDWERKFLLSITNKLYLDGLLNCIDIDSYKDAYEYINSEHANIYGLFAGEYSSNIHSLSTKQINIINKIYSKYI